MAVLAGNGESGFADGNGPDARFRYPRGVAVREDGAIIVADSENHCIRLVTLDGNVTTIAGNGMPGSADGNGLDARFEQPISVTAFEGGTIVVAHPNSNSIRLITDYNYEGVMTKAAR